MNKSNLSKQDIDNLVMPRQPKNKSNLNKIGTSLIVIGVLLIAFASSMLVYNNYQEVNAGKKSADALNIIKNNIPETNLNTINVEEFISSNQEMETTNIDGYDYIGTITIPSINIELPVMSEYDYDRLAIAPCRYYGSIYTNDLIICAHSYKTHFKYLSNLEQKDLVILTDISGNTYIYEVLEIEILKPNDVDAMINNDFDLTLYTCTNDGLNRITVRCNRLTGTI